MPRDLADPVQGPEGRAVEQQGGMGLVDVASQCLLRPLSERPERHCRRPLDGARIYGQFRDGRGNRFSSQKVAFFFRRAFVVVTLSEDMQQP